MEFLAKLVFAWLVLCVKKVLALLKVCRRRSVGGEGEVSSWYESLCRAKVSCGKDDNGLMVRVSIHIYLDGRTLPVWRGGVRETREERALGCGGRREGVCVCVPWFRVH